MLGLSQVTASSKLPLLVEEEVWKEEEKLDIQRALVPHAMLHSLSLVCTRFSIFLCIPDLLRNPKDSCYI